MALASSSRASQAVRWRLVAAVFAVLFLGVYLQQLLRLIPFYRQLYRSFAFYVPESGKSLLQIGLCLVAVRLLDHRTFRDSLRELGLLSSSRRGLAIGFLASAPMLLGFAVAMPLAAITSVPRIAYLALLAPFAEEVLFRAFACGTLYRRAHLPLWLAIGLTAVVFGYGHVEKGQSPAQMVELLLLTGSGGAFFAWFYIRSGFNLWVPFALHVCMNLWWELFDVARTAIGGWYPFALQATTVLVGVLLVEREYRARPGPDFKPSAA